MAKDKIDVPPQIGGSFAPPLDKDKLDAYAALIEDCPDPQVKDAMTTLHKMVVEFGKTPKSRQPGKTHPSGKGTIIPLEDDEVQRMDSLVPWDEELAMFAKLFDKIDPGSQKDLRNAAFHLLWFGRELFLDREPMTKDML